MSLTDPVRVSVIMATWGRGRHILPSVRSVLAQDYRGFELIVVGDHDAEGTVAFLEGTGARWINLPERVGSQSGPNNAGIAAARGDIIAYLGHDDLWEPDHLSRIMALFDADPALDFAVGGCILHMPEGISGDMVTGFFTDSRAPFQHFFPPSSFAHRKTVCDRIGGWNLPFEIRDPVDVDLLRRAAVAGLRFAATNTVSVHKFAAGHRYLAYLEQNSLEQEAMLDRMRQHDHAAKVTALIAAAKAGGTFMALPIHDSSSWVKGDWARMNQSGKGLRAQIQPLGDTPLTLPQTRAHCALDWHEMPEDGIRWSLRAQAPKVLLPVTGTGVAELRLTLHHRNPMALAGLDLSCHGERHHLHPLWQQSRLCLPFPLRRTHGVWQAVFRLPVRLDPVKPVVLTLHLTPNQSPTPIRRGIGLSTMVVQAQV